eukprot:scaffold137334_cov51-Attheya_sp.AAC.7
MYPTQIELGQAIAGATGTSYVCVINRWKGLGTALGRTCVDVGINRRIRCYYAEFSIDFAVSLCASHFCVIARKMTQTQTTPYFTLFS